MKSISVNMVDEEYQALKTLAARDGRSTAELLRRAVAQYLKQEQRFGESVLDIAPHDSGALIESWERSAVFDEMIGS